MFFFLPIGLDESGVHRLPWVTLSIAGACLFAFFATWVVPSQEQPLAPYTELTEYWLQHPQVEAPDSLTRLLLPASRGHLDEARALHPGSATADEQAKFDALASEFLAAVEEQPLRHFALVPARGIRQFGWLSSMFLHFGWKHLLGNFLFLYLVAPFLEDVWGRLVFTGFYLTGGLVAGAAQFASDPHSAVAIAGASGAIAACVGAFMLRFSSRRVRMFYFVWISFRPITGTFFLRAWLWGLVWVGSELLSLLLVGARANGVAVLAHVGGFAFGAVFALALKATGIEKKYLEPSVEKKHEGWVQNPDVERAQGALVQGDRAAARRAYEAAHKADPHNKDATLGLARLELEEGKVDRGARLLERALSHDLAHNDAIAVRTAIEDLGTAFRPGALKPAIGYRIAQLLEEAGNPTLAEEIYGAAGAGESALGAKALARAAELRLASHTDVQHAHGYLNRLAAKADIPADVASRVEQVKKALSVHGVPGGGHHVAIDDSPGAEGILRPTIRSARVLSMAAEGLSLEDETGRRMQLPLSNVLGIAVGIIPAGDGSGRNVVLTDLILAWGSPTARASVIRFAGGALSLPTLFPGLAPQEGYGRFLSHVFTSSGASGLPDRDAILKGQYARYANLAAFETACYGGA